MPNQYTHEELKLLYETSVKDLEFFKKQQWLVTYYGILVYGALVTLAKITTLEKWVFCVVAGVTALLCSVLLSALEHSIGVRRDRLDAVREQFGSEFNHAWKAGKKDSECHAVLVFMLFALLTGAALSIFGILNLERPS